MKLKNKNIFIAGHKGMVGKAIYKNLKKKNNLNLITRTRTKLDLLNFNQVNSFFKKNKIDQIYIAAARAGGIIANSKFQSKFLYENSMIALNIIHAAFLNNIKKILYLGSSCIYPRNRTNLEEKDLLNGELEPTNEGYAIAKILGLKLCEKYSLENNCDFRAIMPCNLFGPNDKFDETNSHVIPALVKKFANAKNKNLKSVEVFGSGRPKREFLHVDDLAEAAIFVMKLNKKKYVNVTKNSNYFLNVGYGRDFSIKEISQIIKLAVKYKGKILYNKKYPDGNPKKLMNSKKIIKLGWRPKLEFKSTLTQYARQTARVLQDQKRL